MVQYHLQSYSPPTHYHILRSHILQISDPPDLQISRSPDPQILRSQILRWVMIQMRDQFGTPDGRGIWTYRAVGTHHPRPMESMQHPQRGFYIHPQVHDGSWHWEGFSSGSRGPDMGPEWVKYGSIPDPPRRVMTPEMVQFGTPDPRPIRAIELLGLTTPDPWNPCNTPKGDSTYIPRSMTAHGIGRDSAPDPEVQIWVQNGSNMGQILDHPRGPDRSRPLKWSNLGPQIG